MPDVDPKPVTLTLKTEEDEATTALKNAAELMAKAASDRANRSELLKEVEANLSKLRIVDFPELADSPVVQSFIKAMGTDNMRPGETRGRGTLAERIREWSERDLSQFPMKTFYADESLPLIWNGLVRHTVSGEENTLPEPFYNIWLDHKKALKQAKIHEDYLLGYSPQTPDPNWMAENSARVRAFSQMGPTPDSRTRGVGFLPPEAEGGE